MKKVRLFIADVVVLVLFLSALLVFRGGLNLSDATKLAANSDGSDLGICEAMQTKGFLQDGDVFRDVTVVELWVSGLCY
jgi:hypothetical protein